MNAIRHYLFAAFIIPLSLALVFAWNESRIVNAALMSCWNAAEIEVNHWPFRIGAGVFILLGGLIGSLILLTPTKLRQWCVEHPEITVCVFFGGIFIAMLLFGMMLNSNRVYFVIPLTIPTVILLLSKRFSWN